MHECGALMGCDALDGIRFGGIPEVVLSGRCEESHVTRC